jgi:hypothetical protein
VVEAPDAGLPSATLSWAVIIAWAADGMPAQRNTVCVAERRDLPVVTRDLGQLRTVAGPVAGIACPRPGVHGGDVQGQGGEDVPGGGLLVPLARTTHDEGIERHRAPSSASFL